VQFTKERNGKIVSWKTWLRFSNFVNITGRSTDTNNNQRNKRFGLWTNLCYELSLLWTTKKYSQKSAKSCLISV